MNTLNVYTAIGDLQLRDAARYCGWFTSTWFLTSLGGMVLLTLFTGLATDAPAGYMLGQAVLGISVYIALSFLADRPLVNPIQAVVAVFYWWFGVGPTVIATWNLFLGKSNAALEAQVSGMEALWVVAPGLILYALVAKCTLNWFSRTGLYARFLLPRGANYRPSVLVVFVSLAGLTSVALMALQWMGIQGREQVSLLGGTKTTIWWVGVIAAVGSIAPFASSALMTALAAPWKKISNVTWILIFIVTGNTILTALYGGWKSPIAVLGAYFICAYVIRNQRPPWMIMIVGILLFVLVITPFVSFGRTLAHTSHAETSTDREEVFGQLLRDPTAYITTEMDAVDVRVLFRGIYPLASELIRRNGYFHGEWNGETIAWGMDSVIPRVLNPDKKDMNIGNFFGRTVGADIGVSGRYDTINNISISIPFEFVGNYGIAAGILSFGLIGFVWTLFSGWLLSPARLSNHPLTPFCVLFVLCMEQPVGHCLASIRELAVPLCVCFVVYAFFRRKL